MTRCKHQTRALTLAAGLWTLSIVSLGIAPAVQAQTAGTAPEPARTGRDLYAHACAACHGPDGKGSPQSTVGFDTPLPDFTNCIFTTPEPNADWMAVVHDGGPRRAFDRRMPAFGEALPEEDILRVIEHLRTFCASKSWPRGELNLPRPLATEKAFPENEAVLTINVAASGPGAVDNEFTYEHRLGARSQFEFVVPVALQEADGRWSQGVGDVAAAFKHTLFHNLDRGAILSLGGELSVPTGKEKAGLGKGTAVIEQFVAFGQILPSDGFLQLHAGVELPVDPDRVEREAFWRVAAGKSLTEGHFGRIWSPMVELLAARELEKGRVVEWDIVPEMQVTLSTRQHIRVNGGFRLPVNERQTRSRQILVYLLWDWADGGLLSGW